jgi:hypothetical protein
MRLTGQRLSFAVGVSGADGRMSSSSPATVLAGHIGRFGWTFCPGDKVMQDALNPATKAARKKLAPAKKSAVRK